MIIDKEQLIELLIDKTGLGKEEVEGQLSELINRINKAAEEGNSFEVEGFGTFKMEDDVLQFVPADRLETEINNKYAGMKPIELIGAFKEPGGEDFPDIAEDLSQEESPAWAFDEDAVGQKQDFEETEESEEKEEVSAGPQEVPEQNIQDEEAQEEFEELISEEASDTKEPATVGADFQDDSGAEESTAPPENKEEQEDSDPIGRFLVAALIVIIVGVGGFLIYDLGVSDNKSGGTSVTNQEPVEEPRQAEMTPSTDDSQNESEDAAEPEQPEEVTKSVEDSQSDAEEPQSTYGLEGKVDPSISDGYTIVVHSLRERQQAEQNMKRLEGQGYRALINRANVAGTTYYRVGIGQFATVGDAQKATDRIPEQYRSNYFIKRIQ